ncbi:hypothetical protein LTR85_000089 [Meristemomyces frigidus]|nr:hypothetical protein LTR85_000089 [Meristemomyces frigidus]
MAGMGPQMPDEDHHYVEPEEFGEERARELYQYYRPPTHEKGEVVFLPYADTVLQAHCQLAACRLDYGSISIPKRGGLVEWTLAQEPRWVNDELVPAHFEALDLPSDPRWRQKKYIATPPHFRYFCGVPLRTENDINIGCLFVMDTQVPEIRESISVRHVKLLTACATNVMVHLRTVKDAHEKQRAFNMNMCIADFISPKDRFRKRAKVRSSAQSKSRRDGKHPVVLDTGAAAATVEQNEMSMSDADDLGETVTQRGRKRPTSGKHGPVLSESPESRAGRNVTDADHQRTFDKAALLIRQSLDLNLGGGVVLFETSASAADVVDLQLHSPKVIVTTSSHSHATTERSSAPPTTSSRAFTHATADDTASRTRKMDPDGIVSERVVLAAASIIEPEQHPITYGRADSAYKVHISPPELQRMCKKYGRGKLFSIPNLMPTSQYDSEGRSIAGVMSARFWFLSILRRQFPDAKQVIFVPMFHANLNRWTACLAYTSSPYRVFSYETDYLHTLSFCNAIRAEIVKLTTIYADQQKGDFIGSVSHELRSPLHGILASLEFLQDSECTAFQKSCLETADACAHTLLDTITMVLDYSKVNSLKKPAYSRALGTASAEEHHRDAKRRDIPRLSTASLIDTNSNCDLALITEEVVDGLATGHLSRHHSNVGFDEAGFGTNSSLIDVDGRSGLRRILCATRPEVELVLDIKSPPEWDFTTQPGAFRRIVMNLFGNSLKYTKHGFVSVSLRVEEDHAVGQQTPCFVKLVIQDTGQGISPDYLRTKMFTPFSQENAQAAGTGLGLSIVRAIVNMLQGDIDIKSLLNVGTIATVTIPMKRATPRAASTSAPNYQRAKDPSVMALRSMTNPPKTAIYEPALEDDGFGQTQGVTAVQQSLLHYLSDWYHLPAVRTSHSNDSTQLLLVDEVHLPTLLAGRPTLLDASSRQSLIVLCANPMRQAIMAKDITSGQVELLCKPFGPYKLARVICRALEKAAKSDTSIETVQLPDAGAGPITAPLSTHASMLSQRQSIFLDDTPGAAPMSPVCSPGTLYPGQTVSRASSNATQKHVPARTHVKERSAGPDGGYPFPAASPLSAPASPTMPKPASLVTAQPTRPTFQHRSNYDIAKPGDQLAPPQPTTSIDAETMRNSPATVPTRKPRLLLVDDNRVNLQLLHTFVKKKGYGDDIVKTAEDGLQAFNSFKASASDGVPPDIIFMDISMPVMDGYEATRRIRHEEGGGRRANVKSQDHGLALKLPKRALVIALTGNTGGNDRIEAFESGMDVYLTKPMSMKEVGKVLENWRE